VAGLCEKSGLGIARPEDTELGSRDGESAPGSDAALSGKAELALKTGRRTPEKLDIKWCYFTLFITAE